MDNIINLLPYDIDGLLIVSQVNRLFFTGFNSSDGFLLITKNGTVFLTDSRYIEEARNKIKFCKVEELTSFSKQMPELCRELNCSVLGIEADRLTVSELKQYRRLLKNIKLTTIGTDKIIDRLRAVKRADEVDKIVKAQHIAEKAFDHILGFIRQGVTEKQIALELDYYMLSHGADALSFETIAISGANTSKPHGVPTEKKIEIGDFITMDYGAVIDGYHSDMTRTVAFGSVSDEQIKIYNTVLDAQLAVLKELKPGLKCADADKFARNIISDKGCGEYFRHSTGHGVGVEIHEKPNLSPKSKGVLETGNVVTVEPGIYLPGKFGVRIEDMALITENGNMNLTNIDKSLLVLN